MGKTLVAVCSGRWNGIALVDLKTEETRQWVPLDRTFNGAAFSKDGKKLFVTGGNSDALYVFNFDGQKVDKPKTFHLDAAASPARKDNDFLAGMIVDSKSGKLYICNEGSSDILVVDPNSGKVGDKWKAQSHPYTCALGVDGRYLYVSNWGDKSVSALDMESGEEAGHIAVGMRPNEMAVAPDGRLFVTCAGDNTVHVILQTQPQDTDRDAHTDAKTPPPADSLEIISTSLYPSSPEGSTPDAVAVSPDGKSLFVANADNNDVMIADIADAKVSRVVGFVPVGWYPCALASNGKKLFVANGKGLDSRPSYPPEAPEPNKVRNIPFDHTPSTLAGSVSIIDAPTPEQLTEYTKQVRANSPIHTGNAQDILAAERFDHPQQNRRSLPDQACALHHQRESHV